MRSDIHFRIHTLDLDRLVGEGGQEHGIIG